MAGMSNYLENKILVDYLTGGAVVYVSLHVSDPLDGTASTEPVGGGYARILGTGKFTVTGDTAVNNVELLSPEATAIWGDITHVGIWTAATGGNLLYSGPFTEVKNVGVGDIYRIKVGQLSITNG